MPLKLVLPVFCTHFQSMKYNTLLLEIKIQHFFVTLNPKKKYNMYCQSKTGNTVTLIFPVKYSNIYLKASHCTFLISWKTVLFILTVTVTSNQYVIFHVSDINKLLLLTNHTCNITTCILHPFSYCTYKMLVFTSEF